MAENRASDGFAQRIEQFFQRLRQLSQEGRHQEAIALATQIRDRAHQAHQSGGPNHLAYAYILDRLAAFFNDSAT